MISGCNPGDLAMIVRNTAGVVCVEAAIGTPVTVEYVDHFSVYFGAVWKLKTPLVCNCHGGMIDRANDADLQPIRGKPAEEGAVTWVEIKPREIRREGTTA